MTNERSQLAAAEVLILVFPTWWFGFPAILKGWFDRVWAPGVAYQPVPELRMMAPRLTGQRANRPQRYMLHRVARHRRRGLCGTSGVRQHRRFGGDVAE